MRTLLAVALLATVLAFLPSGAHLLELPSKLALDRDAYLTVQGIYRGWALLGIVWIAALVLDALAAWRLRRQRGAMLAAAAAAVLLALAFAVFFAWTFPANQATANWTVLPDGWESLRARWEGSHAANAGLTFAAVVAMTVACIAWRRPVP